MTTISTHVLDTAHGKPAAGIAVQLESRGADTDAWIPIGSGTTNSDGRVAALVPDGTELSSPHVRVTFATESYHRNAGQPCFYPSVSIEAQLDLAESHYHIPLLLSPYGFSTYRGS